MLTTIVAAAFVLGVVVLVHELGHFLVAKWAGVYVKTFSIGFGRKILRRRYGETEYCISLLPFGGYVKFAGETDLYEEGEEPEEDENSDEVPDSQIPRDRYFTTKPPLARAAVLFAGPFMNYVLAVLIYIGVFLFVGTQVTPTTRIGSVTDGTPADSVGLLAGDEILAVDGEAVSAWEDVQNAVLSAPETVKRFRIVRDGVESEVSLEPRVQENRVVVGIQAMVPPEIGRVQKGKPAYDAGIRAGSVIESINDTLMTTFDDVREFVHRNPGVPLEVTWTHDGETFRDTITPEPKDVLEPGSTTEFVKVGLIGIGPTYEQRREPLGSAISSGFRTANFMIVRIVTYLKDLILRKMGVETLGGPILIAQMAGDVANWGFDYLMMFLAFFNINLCIFNLLPVLPFDGGHLAIIGIEGVIRRPLNKRLRGWLNQGGFILIILLMVFVVLLDLSRCAGGIPGF